MRFDCAVTAGREGERYYMMTDDSIGNANLLKIAFSETVRSVMTQIAHAYGWVYEGDVMPFRSVSGLVVSMAHSVMRKIESPQVLGTRVKFESKEYAIWVGGPLNPSPNGSAEYFSGQVIGADFEHGVPVAIVRVSPAVIRAFMVDDPSWIEKQIGKKLIVEVSRIHGGRRCWLMKRHYTYPQFFDGGELVATTKSRHATRVSTSRQVRCDGKWSQVDFFEDSDGQRDKLTPLRPLS